MSKTQKRIAQHATDCPGVKDWTDKYFTRTADIIDRYGDAEVIYAVFIRRPCVMACDIAIDWIRDQGHEVIPAFERGAQVGAGDPLFFIRGSFARLVELETLILQKTGLPCIAAANACDMAVSMPETAFLAMDARHNAGLEMTELAAYGVSVGSQAAQAKGAKGFIGNATDATAHYFGNESGMGTMPHALIGYAGSTVKAADMFHTTHPDVPLTVLVDYFGREVSDALEVCRHFDDLAGQGRLSIRLDTHGGRYMEGLDPQEAYAVLERNQPSVIRQLQSEQDRRHLMGTGVSAAAIWFMREQLDQAGYDKVSIIASSGFNTAKCRVFAAAKAPVNVIGTGSTLPEQWSDCYATADIIAYDGEFRVKQGRDYLIQQFQTV